MNIAQIVSALETEQQKHAVEALEKPRGESSFEYGRAVGILAGIKHARNVLEEMYREEQDKRNRM